MKLNLETRMRCNDGVKVRLADIVVDPRTRTVTHLVIVPERTHHQARLVPLDVVDADDEDNMKLTCSDADLDGYPLVSATDYLELGAFPIAEPGWAIGIEDVLVLPHYDADLSDGWYGDHYTLGWDRIPEGEVEIRRDSVVTSSDGREIGHVDGFVCDDGGHVTHLVLQHGHALGHRDLAIPIGRVDRLANGRVEIRLTAEQIDELPGVSVHRWHHPHHVT
jgi:sporulation protein YlmC with PRC-barrel domain